MSDSVSSNKSTNVRVGQRLRGAAWRVLRLFSQALPGAAARLADTLWSRPLRFPRPAWERDLLARATPLTIPHGLVGLAGWSWGETGAADQPTALLVHGWSGRGAQLGALVDPLVAAGYRVVTWDMPAHGDSPGRRANLVLFADAIAAAIRHVGPVQAIVAHSMGGAATTYALSGMRRPGAADSAPRVVYIAAADGGEAFRRLSRATGLGADARTRMEKILTDRLGITLSALSADALATDLDADLLLLHDRRDRAVPWRDGAVIAEAWPGARLELTEGLGHMRILRDPQVVERAVGFIHAHAAGYAA